jgi:hypothetical protein
MDSLAKDVAAELLKTDGVAAIWKLHMVAARVFQDGHPAEAEKLLRIADAAEHAISRVGFEQESYWRAMPPRRH